MAENSATLQFIARMRSAFPTKFGIPRQSGLVSELRSTVVFEPAYRSEEAVRGLGGFSHIWLLWHFSGAVRSDWSPTVRPPRLGGNKRVGVFATRSPFRPNPLGLSCVKLESIEHHPTLGPVLHVSGADLMDGTPIFDVKPYIPYGDCHPEASEGFTAVPKPVLEVEIPPALLDRVPEGLRAALIGVLAQDPRPAYQKDPQRTYVLPFGGLEIKFFVAEGRAVVTEIWCTS